MEWLLATLGSVFALDRCAKRFVFRRLGVAGPSVSAGRLAIRPVRNTQPRGWPGGSAFGWSASFASALVAALLLVELEPRSSATLAIGLGAALGGALGNLYDRIRHGAVLDFLHVGIGGVFNPADVALVLGLVVVLASRVALATSFLTER